MILKIKSKNKYLLDILYKNPETDSGLYFKPLKNGIIAGNAINENEYEVIFQDTKYSYLPEDSNQIDFQSFCNPLVILHISTELFSHLLKEKKEYHSKDITWRGLTQGKADTEECSIDVPSFFIHSNWYREGRFLLCNYFSGIELIPKQGKVFSLKITAPSVFEAFNLLNLVSLFTHITNEYGLFTYINDDFAQKYVRILTNIDNVPYFVFYLFIKRAIKSEKQFINLKPLLEEYLKNKGITANLTWFSTHSDRVQFITSQLEKDIPILDIGCGEFIYYKKMMNQKFDSRYIAIDKDENFQTMAINISERLKSDNLEFYTSLGQVKTEEKVNILLTEVIEHNTIEEAKNIIKQAVNYNFNKIFITTPNSDFNSYYSKDLDKRHDDHHFELSSLEFQQLIENSLQGIKNIQLKYEGIGDNLNGIQPTQAVIISKN